MEASVEDIMVLVASGDLNPKAAAKLIQDKLDEAQKNMEQKIQSDIEEAKKKLQSDMNEFLSDRLKDEYEEEFNKLENNTNWEEYARSLDFKLKMLHLQHGLKERKRIPPLVTKPYWECIIFAELEQIIKIYMDRSGKK
jgi:polyhydroxyalkanoate synthesis regulator phasin